MPAFTFNRPNIFSDRQEQWLGDAQAREQEPDYILLPEKESGELTRIGQKLLVQLPPTSIHYHFRVYESEEANAFSSPGGYVYVSRKLITDARSEDEIAGVLAHEIGHIYTHQEAIEFSHRFKVRMNVTSFASEEELNDKLQQLLNIHVKSYDGPSGDQLDKDEFLADRVGMYAMTRAGYAPRAFAECLDRVSGNKGRLGSFLTDMLDINSIETRRVRASRSLANELSRECKNRVAGSSPEFKVFQEKILSAPVNWLVEATPGLPSLQIDPPLRAALDRVRFSPNGQYVLAQDESKIHVLSRAPLKRLFSIDAAGAEEAHFSPDSKQVVFHYQNMRVERWDVAAGKREKFFELVDYKGCPQTSLSPDGKIFVCLSLTDHGIWLKMMDVDTGKLLYDDKNFFAYSFAAHLSDIGSIAFSQDGHSMVVATGNRAMAYDLTARKAIHLGGNLPSMGQGSLAFVDSNKLVFYCGDRVINESLKMCESTFPEGNPIHDFPLGYQWMDTVTHGNHVLIGPFRDSASALVDPSTGKASAAFKLNALDLYDQTIASESAGGGVTVGELGNQKMESVELPISPMLDLAAAAFSPDGRFLAFSNRSRSIIWDLDAQKQVALMRPFRAVRFDDEDQMFAQYQESHLKPGQNSHIDLKTGKVTELAKYDQQQIQQGNVLVSTRKMDKFEYDTENTEMDVFDRSSGVKLWSKRFPHEMPILRHTDSGAILLLSDLAWQTAADETGHSHDKLINASDKKGEWLQHGLLVEVLESRTGTVQRQIALPQPRYVDQEHDRRAAVLYGDYLVIYGNDNNSTIYRLSDGQRLGSFFGRAIAGDGKLGLIAATNLDQEITLYDANTAQELKRVTVDHLPRAARIVPAKNALLVLTASQRVYSIALPALPGK